jgi:homoserine dehydrogenase
MTPESTTKVALTGFGSVGRALAEILIEQPGLPIAMTLVADRGGYVMNPDGLNPADVLAAKAQGSVSTHPQGTVDRIDRTVLSASQADVLLELASTNYDDGEPGWTYVQAAFDAGLNVVLASKGPLVAHWDELFAQAKVSGKSVGLSATHGAPVPVVDFARFGLAGSKIIRVRALFNSTTGLLLELMEKGNSLDQAIRIVSSAGVAETNPRLDIEGWDAAAKCVIVGRSLFGGNLSLDQVDRTGIENLTTAEVVDAAAAGTPIKLLCTLDPVAGGVRARVHPECIQPGDPLATLRHGNLGVVYDADPIGPQFVSSAEGWSGQPSVSGGRPTAAAVIRDVLLLQRQ